MSELDDDAKALLRKNLKTVITHTLAATAGFVFGVLLCL